MGRKKYRILRRFFVLFTMSVSVVIFPCGIIKAERRNMVFEQDYVMRLIKEMVRVFLKLLFQIDTESPTVELLEDKEEKETLERLLDMIDNGKINEAENRLYDLIREADVSSLEIALLFYSCLNDKTDDFLEANDFGREEIKSGLENVVDRFGLSSIAKMFLTDF